MAGFTFTEAAVKRIVKDCRYTESLRRNDRARRRRHVTVGGSTSTAGGLAVLRLEEDLCPGNGAEARLMDCSGTATLPGPKVSVSDPLNKAFSRGTPAPRGDDGGDGQDGANIVLASDCGGGSYVFVNGGTYYKHISGTLPGDTWQVCEENIGGLSDGGGAGNPLDFVYWGDQAGSGSRCMMLSAPCGLAPRMGAAFKAELYGCDSYEVYVYCCEE